MRDWPITHPVWHLFDTGIAHAFPSPATATGRDTTLCGHSVLVGIGEDRPSKGPGSGDRCCRICERILVAHALCENRPES